MKSLKKVIVVAIGLFSISATTALENNYSLSKDYAVTILGTSNLHDWNEAVQTVTGNCSVSWNEDGSFNLDKLYLDMNVNSIKSTEGGIMDRNTYKALKADAHPDIIFSLENPIKVVSSTNSISAQGLLSIAGVTKPITMEVKVSIQDHNIVSFQGAKAINMTDFGIQPPTALFGTLKTVNSITINFKTNFILTAN
jgi:polyisoprenoid-binding protein YceI